MIALSDKEIRLWNDKINLFNKNKNISYDILPRYTSSSSSYPSIGISIYQNYLNPGIGSVSNSLRHEEDRSLYSIYYEYTFSIIDEKDEDLQNELLRLRKGKIGNSTILPTSDKESEINIKNDISEEKVRHSVNGKNYIRYTFSATDYIPNIIGHFHIIETALELSTRERKFKINDIVSLVDDRSDDYLIVNHSTSNNFTLLKIKNITDNIINYESDEIVLKEDKVTWSRNSRIDNIID